jgi:hypothetical protein
MALRPLLVLSIASVVTAFRTPGKTVTFYITMQMWARCSREQLLVLPTFLLTISAILSPVLAIVKDCNFKLRSIRQNACEKQQTTGQISGGQAALTDLFGVKSTTTARE